MSRRVPVLLTFVAGYLLMSLAGCAGNANLTLKYAPEDVTTYKVSMQTIKDYRFEQPSLTPPKVNEQQSGTTVDVVFDQKIEGVETDGTAVAAVTIKDVTYIIKEKDSLRFDFDSTREADKNKPFAKVIGQTYRIKISPDGSVETLDAKAARAAVTAGFQGQVADAFFKDERIAARHEILALPDPADNPLKVGKSWSRVVPSPKGMLSQKSYKKVYTLTKLEGPKDNKTATIEMTASESAEAAADTSSKMSGMGFFANMFDTQEAYTGKLVLETSTGTVKEYSEKLVATYLAAEEPQGDSGGKGPDTLTMGFTYAVSREIVE